MKLPNFKHADKVAHAIGGLIIFALVRWATDSNEAGFGASAIIGVLKEVLYDRDRRENHSVDAWDAVATAGGGALGWLVAGVIW